MFIPEGYTEEEVLAILDRAIWPLAENMKFGYNEASDMYQEGFILASNVMSKYESEGRNNCSLENFIRIHVRNRFINMRRDQLYRTTSPCLNCATLHNCTLNVIDCPKYAAWLRRNNAKRSIMESTELEDREGECPDLFEDMWKRDFLEYVKEHISIYNRASLLKLLDNVQLIKKKREELIDELKILYSEFSKEDIDGEKDYN